MRTTKKNCRFPILLVLPQKEDWAEQFLNGYQVPEVREKELVLHEIMLKIEEGKQREDLRSVRLIKTVYRSSMAIAASLVLIFLLHFLLAENTIKSGGIAVHTLRLPDHSRMVLSRNSSASYPRYWWKREVKLHGEAYFEVEKGEKFIVKTNDGNVSVLGTRFQVTEIANGLIVSCYDGKVKFTEHGQTKVVEAGHSLKYKDQVFAETGTIQGEYPQLAFFNRSFSNEELSTVLKELENFFDVHIHFTSSGTKHFTGKLETGKAETAIQIICRSLNLDYSFSSKEEILIHEKEKSYES